MQFDMPDINFPRFAWYLDITPNQMFSLYDYPIPGKNGLPLCQEHGKRLEMKEVVVLDQTVTELLHLTTIGCASEFPCDLLRCSFGQ